MSNSAGEGRGSWPRYGYPQVNGSERPSRSAAQNRLKKGGEGEEVEGEVWPSHGLASAHRSCFTAGESKIRLRRGCS